MGAAVLLLVALGLTGCDSPPAPAPPEPEVTRPPPPPPVPELATLGYAPPGHGKVAVPERNDRAGRYEHRVIESLAHFGKIPTSTVIRMGSEDDGATLIFYGETLTTGQHPVRPATDETLQAVRQGNDGVFTITHRRNGLELRSVSGTVTVDEADDQAVRGSFDVQMESPQLAEPTVARGVFNATHDAYLTATLEHQAEIQEQLRQRSRGGGR